MSIKSAKKQIQLIHQSLNTAANALNLSKQLLRDLEDMISEGSMGGGNVPGIIGTFDGRYLITSDGEKYEVPQNYASKSKIVYGDTLKKIEQDGGVRFKQIKRVKRQKVVGVLAKKEGKWVIVGPDGSYKVLDAAVEHYGLKEGDEAIAILPLDNKHAPFAALDVQEEEKKEDKEKAVKVQKKEPRNLKVEEEKKVTKKKVEKKKGAKKEQKGEMSLKEEKKEEKKEPPKILSEEDLR